MARQLSENEKAQIAIESDSWYPTLFTTYGTLAVKMLANPYKYALINTIFAAIVIAIYVKLIKPKQNAGLLVIVCVLLLLAFGGSAYKQYMTNGNVIGLLPKLQENATKFDYLNNYAVQGDLYRSQGRVGSSLIAGAIGGAAAGSFGRRH
jgi:hypothetical protein